MTAVRFENTRQDIASATLRYAVVVSFERDTWTARSKLEREVSWLQPCPVGSTYS